MRKALKGRREKIPFLGGRKLRKEMKEAAMEEIASLLSSLGYHFKRFCRTLLLCPEVASDNLRVCRYSWCALSTAASHKDGDESRLPILLIICTHACNVCMQVA